MKTKVTKRQDPSRGGAMRFDGRVVAIMIALALWIDPATVGPVRADVSAPDNILYGAIVLGSNQVTASSTSIVVEARRTNGIPIARYRMGSRSDAGNFYTLAIMAEEIAPARGSTAVLVNETLNIVVMSDGVIQTQKPFVVSERGQVNRLDFGEPTTNGLTGFEAWAWFWGLGTGSQDQDSDDDGVSNYAEYLAGTSPINQASTFLLHIGRNQFNTRVSFDAIRAEGTGFEGRTRHYALQQSTDLGSGTWEDVAGFSDIVGANQVVVYDSAGTTAPRFFRGKAWLDEAFGDFRLMITRDAGQLKLTFTARRPDEKGRDYYYTVERSPSLQAGTWSVLPGCSNVLGANQIVTIPLPKDGVNPGFYRGRLELRSP